MMQYDILTVAAIVAAYVTVFRGLRILSTKYLPFVALAVAAVFVLVPPGVQEKMIIISTIGLSAAGVYELSRGKGSDGK